MRILLTGASSFTGYWFASELAKAGHDVVATFQGKAESYEGVRQARLGAVADLCTTVYECSFGTKRFIDLVRSESAWDALCHHAANVHNYRSPDFDINAALAGNTHNMREVLEDMAQRGCKRVIHTGSVFEKGEGAGSADLPSFSPYAVSKSLSAEIINYYAGEYGLHSGKFVIPNPFGPYEEPRFTHYLMQTWARGEVASVNTPAYVRDNIHVSLLAGAYVDFVQNTPATAGTSRTNPSGYIESQGQFAERCAQIMRSKTGFDCGLQLKQQTTFDEPLIRINTEPASTRVSSWSESNAWDQMADYYASMFSASADPI